MSLCVVCVCLLYGADSGVGTIYVSDDRGTVFSKSLERHLYSTTGSDTDFSAISSLRGVYMTSVLTEGGSTHCMLIIPFSHQFLEGLTETYKNREQNLVNILILYYIVCSLVVAVTVKNVIEIRLCCFYRWCSGDSDHL